MTSQIQDLAISDLNSIPLTNTISFDYIRPTDVKVQVGTTLSNLAEKTYITDWTITNDKKIQFATNVFTATGTYKVRIYRVTDASSPTHVFNAGSSIRSKDLNDISKQTLFVADEVRDTVNSLSTDGSGVSNVIIDGSNIADNSITTTKILDLEVTTADLSNGAVTTPKIGDTQVTDTKLANDSVTTRAIKDGEITRPKIAPANITDVELSTTLSSTAAIPGRSGQFTAPNITVNDQGRVTAIQDGVIPTSQIANGAVTLDKLSAATQIAVAPPVGAVFWFATHVAPAGYLECNGDAIPNGVGTVQGKTADFSALYGVIGQYLPHISDEHFIRGHGGAAAMRTRDAQRFKSFTLYSFPSGTYTHQAYMGKQTTSFGPSTPKWTAGNSGQQWAYQLKWDTTETRPKSIALLPIIKF